MRASNDVPFTLSLSKGESVIHGSISSPRTDLNDSLDTLLGFSMQAEGYDVVNTEYRPGGTIRGEFLPVLEENDVPEFEGVVPAIITPMFADGEINEEAFRAVMEDNIQAGVHGFWTAGRNG